MNTNHIRWKKLFFCCLGLFIGTAFCMKWMEGDLKLNGQTFTVIGLELTYPKEKIASIFLGIDEHVKAILRYNLIFDFAFMAGVYPGIAALCMMAKRKHGKVVGRILLALALLQIVAWGCDIFENCSLLNWIKDPHAVENFSTYHLIVYAKWTLALIGAFVAIPLVLIKKKKAMSDPTLEQTV